MEEEAPPQPRYLSISLSREPPPKKMSILGFDWVMESILTGIVCCFDV